jgi:hypothetical protein
VKQTCNATATLAALVSAIEVLVKKVIFVESLRDIPHVGGTGHEPDRCVSDRADLPSTFR